MKIILLLITIISISNLNKTANAQTPNWQWAKGIGGTGRGTCISNDAMGNVLSAGYFDSSTLTFGTITLTNSGGSDMYVVKYDSSGNVLWAKAAGGISNEQALGISTDANGNVFMTGVFSSAAIFFDSITLYNSGATDMFIVKYDTDGNVLWAKNASGTGSERAAGIAADSGGNVFITGSFDSPAVIFGTITLNNSGSANAADLFTVKYDSSGNVLWAKSAAGNVGINTVRRDEATSVAVDAVGGVYVTGFFASLSITFDSITLTNNTSTSIGWCNTFIAKYDANGNLLWVKNAGGDRDDLALGISTDLGGNVFITGYFDSGTMNIGSITINHGGGPSSKSLFIVKYDTNGNALWAKMAGYPWINSYAYSYSVTTDTGGNVFITGEFESPSITFGTVVLINAGWRDIFTVKYNSAGNIIWAISVGGTSREFGSDITVDAGGNVYLTGVFDSPAINFGTTALAYAGPAFNTSVFIAKLDSSTSTGIAEQQSHDMFDIAPNPLISESTIRFKEEQINTKLKITDALGYNIYETSVSGKQHMIKKSEMKSGVYFIHLITDQRTTYYKRLVVL